LRKLIEKDFENFNPNKIIALDDLSSQEAANTGGFAIEFEGRYCQRIQI